MRQFILYSLLIMTSIKVFSMHNYDELTRTITQDSISEAKSLIGKHKNNKNRALKSLIYSIPLPKNEQLDFIHYYEACYSIAHLVVYFDRCELIPSLAKAGVNIFVKSSPECKSITPLDFAVKLKRRLCIDVIQQYAVGNLGNKIILNQSKY